MFDKEFYRENREALCAKLPVDSVAVFFAGDLIRKSADANYTFFANRNFVYLTGMEEPELIYMAVKTAEGARHIVFLREPDAMKERWTGKRIHAEDVEAKYGAFELKYVPVFEETLREVLSGGIGTLWLDLDRKQPQNMPEAAERFAQEVAQWENAPVVRSLNPIMRELRTIKKPCEIEAMRKAVPITKSGIEAMMKVARPGMPEWRLKAEFDYALAQRGVPVPAFTSIISSGKNNFCIHYEEYTGILQEGDMVLNDVGAQWDNECNDVSRAWPVSGKFNERQRALYTCILETSREMFRRIKPGIPMASVDETARQICFEKLKALGLLDDYRDIRKLMWHGGAHHVGFDVHDVVDMSRDVAPGMVFCVDIGVYCEEWGIGFRLEDNCLITQDGCENLTREIPSSIEDIEATIARLRSK